MNQISLTTVAESYGDHTATMNSLEISELTGSRHDSVKRTVERLADSGAISLPPLVEVKVQRERRAETVEAYVFSGPQGRLDSITVVAQLDPAFTAALVKRWDALETGKAKPAMVQNEAPQQIDRPDPQAFAVVQSAWVEAVERKIASKREALQFLRDASAVMIHGVDVLQRAAQHKPAVKALPAPTQSALTVGESVPYELRAKGTKSATELLHAFGAPISAKEFYDIMEKKNMVTTRYTPDTNDSGYRVLIGDGLSYGQNVMQFESTRSSPYFYADKFGALLGRVGPLDDVAPKPTAAERALHEYKTILCEAWESCGKPIDDNSGFPYVTRSALVEYLVGTMGKMQKTACNMAAPRGTMMRPLLENGFVIHHGQGQGWLIIESGIATHGKTLPQDTMTAPWHK